MTETPVLPRWALHVHVRNTFTQHQRDMYEDRTHDLRVTNMALQPLS